MTRLRQAIALFNAHKSDLIKVIIIELLISIIISASLGLLANIFKHSLFLFFCLAILAMVLAWANTTFVLNLVRNIVFNLRFEPALSKAFHDLGRNMKKDFVPFLLYTVLLSCGFGLVLWVLWLILTLFAPSAIVFYMRIQYSLRSEGLELLFNLVSILATIAVYIAVFGVLIVANFIQFLTLHKEEQAMDGKVIQPISYDLAYALIPSFTTAFFLLLVSLIIQAISFLFLGRPFRPGLFTTLFISLMLELIETTFMITFALVLNTSKSIWTQAQTRKKNVPPVILPGKTPDGHRIHSEKSS